MLANKFHPATLLLVGVIWLIAALTNYSWLNSLIILGFALFNLVILVGQSFKLRPILWFSLSLIPMLVAMSLSNYLFADPNMLLCPTIPSFISDCRIFTALEFGLRLFNLAVISFMFTIHTNISVIVNQLMQRNLLSINLGYAILAIANAFTFLGREFRRIQIAYQMRYQRRYFSPKIILPLLVAAARYSQQLAVSLHSRGLNPNKSFVDQKLSFSYLDYAYCLFNLLIVIIIYKTFHKL